MALEETGQVLQKLETLYDALLTIQATSVEAERVFSTAGLFLTKIRNRMSDTTLDNFIFMKSRLARD